MTDSEWFPPVVQVTGRFDAYRAPEIDAWIREQQAQGQSRLIVDLGQATFIDSTALSALVNGMKRARAMDGDLALCNLAEPVRIIMELTRLDRAFTIVENAAAARALWATAN